jgi:hypothetical protein
MECYKARGQTNPYKITQDIYTGKVAEIGVHTYLKGLGLKPAPVDFEIYAAKQKSFAADIVATGKNFHVKSQTSESAEKYGKSYLLQKRDPLLRKAASMTEIFVPTLVYEDTIEIYGFIPAAYIPMDFIKEPKLKWLASTKVAIYLEDFMTLTARQRWKGIE